MIGHFRHSPFIFLVALAFLSMPGNGYALCPTPNGLATTSIQTNSATFSWAFTNVDSLLVRWNVTGTTNYFYRTIKPATITSTTVTGLYPNTNYTWAIRSFCGSVAPSNYQQYPAQFTTLPGTISCAIPNLTVTSGVEVSSATLSWNTSVTADSFLIRYAPKGTTNYSWIKLAGSVYSHVLTGLPPNTSYDWWVRCICASNPAQSYSVKNTFTTLSPTCPTADSYYFTATNIDQASAKVQWIPNMGAVSYNIRYALRYSGNWVQDSAGTYSYSILGLLPDSWYEYQVQINCPGGSGPWSASAIFKTSPVNVMLTRGPYLQLSTTSSIFIRWRTNIPSNSQVRYGTSPSNLNNVVDQPQVRSEHIVQLTGLVPNTKYYYSVGSSTITLQGDTGNYFRTNPMVGTVSPVRIWTIGDFGVSSLGQQRVRDSYMNYPGSADTDLWLWVGDNAYVDGTDTEYSNHVFGQYPYQMKKWVIWPATGNHDLHAANASSQSGPFFDIFTLPKAGEAGGVPSGTEAYYSYNYANIHFVCLESTDAAFRASNGAMATWLANDLAANTQRWTIVYFHHPPYSKGSHDSDVDIEMIQMRTNIIPILEHHKVDLVLTGHSHAYERSMLIKGHYGLENTFSAGTMAVNPGSGTFPAAYVKTSPAFSGTVYIVCGVSGQIGGTKNGWPHNAMYSSSIGHFGSLVIDIVGDRLDCKFLTASSTIYDQFSIQKMGASLQRIAGGVMDPAVPAGEPFLVFPNPLIYEGTIRYVLDKDAHVHMEITDMAGRVLYTLVDGEQEEGEYEIKLTRSEAVLPAGIYFIRMITGEKSYLKKIVISD